MIRQTRRLDRWHEWDARIAMLSLFMTAFLVAPAAASPVITEIIRSGLDDPSGIAVDSSGNVYVTGYWSDTVLKITPAGVITTIIYPSVYNLRDCE